MGDLLLDQRPQGLPLFGRQAQTAMGRAPSAVVVAGPPAHVNAGLTAVAAAVGLQFADGWWAQAAWRAHAC